jgi:tryptophan 2,3-dioxygenase
VLCTSLSPQNKPNFLSEDFLEFLGFSEERIEEI